MADKLSWNEMSSDVIEFVFTKLPERSVLRAASVCKRWSSVARASTFIDVYASQAQVNKVSTFLFKYMSLTYPLTLNGRNFTVQLVDHDWTSNLPSVTSRSNCQEEGYRIPCRMGGGGIIYALSNPEPEGEAQQVAHYKLCLLEQDWKVTAKAPYRMDYPIVGVVKNSKRGTHKIVFAGGVEDTPENENGLRTQIFDPKSRSWEACDPLPHEFRGCASSLYMTAAVHRDRMIVYDSCTAFVSELDISTKRWSKAKIVRLSAMVNQLYFVSHSEGLCLLSVEDANETDLRFNMWSVHESTLQLRELLSSAQVLNARPARLPAYGRWLLAFNEALSVTAVVVLYLLCAHFIHLKNAFISGLTLANVRLISLCNIVRRSVSKTGTGDQAGRQQTAYGMPSFSLQLENVDSS